MTSWLHASQHSALLFILELCARPMPVEGMPGQRWCHSPHLRRSEEQLGAHCRYARQRCCPLCRAETYQKRRITDGREVHRHRCAVRVQAVRSQACLGPCQSA